MEFLSQSGVEFTDKNIRTDLDAMQDMVRMGSQATPTTVIDGETIIIGFDRNKLSEELGL
ncbi:glutaredoxin family protein [Rubrobacter indicoceani]|uniref:glutaredoxin family protein n=1 Tax=Rubrobacter indicoceani TaxID=2051957 RepID=UPI000E5B9241|nr:glutaredoxin family protein [Rubrobacter indicoceani]